MPVSIRLPKEFSIDRLPAIVSGDDPALPRARAIWLLQQSQHPKRIDVLAELVRDDQQPAPLRHQAVLAMATGDPDRASVILRQDLSHVKNPSVQAVIAQILGRTAGPEALDELDALAQASDGYVRAQAQFAGTLIAYRYQLPGHEFAQPSQQAMLSMAPDELTRTMVIKRPLDKEAQLVLNHLGHRPLGLSLAPSAMAGINCEPNRWMLALDRELVGENGVRRLQQSKMLAGVMALKSEETQHYSTAYQVLTTPRGQTVDIVLADGRGEPFFAGQGVVAGGGLRFTVEAVDRPGVVAVRLEGSLVAGRLSRFDAVSAIRKRPARVPAH